jgi:hypothetical protein
MGLFRPAAGQLCFLLDVLLISPTLDHLNNICWIVPITNPFIPQFSGLICSLVNDYDVDKEEEGQKDGDNNDDGHDTLIQPMY